MDKLFLTAEEVAEIMGVSLTYAYKLIHRLNEELSEKGFITLQGRVDRKYFFDQFYGTVSRTEQEG